MFHEPERSLSLTHLAGQLVARAEEACLATAGVTLFLQPLFGYSTVIRCL